MELERRVRAGDPSVWPLWDPRPLSVDEVHDGWRLGLERRGEPGFPSMVHAYVHFPYCASSCNFCMYYHEVPQTEARYVAYADYLVGLSGVLRRKLGRVEASHAYFGGGTPSAMPHAELRRVLVAWKETFSVRGEFSFEAHPAVTEPRTIELCAEHGVNRLSMGVQSLDPEVLKKITRRNRDVDGIGDLVRVAQSLGMVVNLDLVTGLPGQTRESIGADLARLLGLGPDRVTLYAYQPVMRLPSETAELTPSLVVASPPVQAAAARAGYRSVILPHVVLLRRASDEPRRALQASAARSGDDAYVEFDADPSQLIGLGTGAYSHVYGRAALREVTDLTALDPEHPVYFGTPMTTEDECRQLVLAALGDRRCIQIDHVRRATGVDVEAWLAGLGAGDLIERGSCHPSCLVPRADAAEAVADRVAPPSPRAGTARRRLPVVVPRSNASLVSVHPETTRPTQRARSWLSALGVAGQGSRIGEVWVRKVSDFEVFFAVDDKLAPPLRVRVDEPGASGAFVSSRRFALVHCSRPEPVTARERAFLAYLARATLVKDGE